MRCRALRPWVYLFEGTFLVGLPEGKLNMEILGFSDSLGCSNLPPLPV
jgi:hypothetical protein